MEYDDLTRQILFSLHRKGYYGAKHTPVIHICKRLPRHSCKEIKLRIKNLLKAGILTRYPTNHGLDIHININKSSEVKDIIKPLEEEMSNF